jgi:sulfate permease, SulP family
MNHRIGWASRLFLAARPGSARAAAGDGLAGVILASMNVPQLLGYARIAGLPLVSGLYTAVLVPIAFAAFGSSRHLVVAADSGTAAILAGSLGQMATPGGAHYIALAGLTALITAAMLLLARVFRLGFLADFLSRTVLTGFLTGVGIQVAVAMLGDMLGLAGTARGLVRQVMQIATGIGQVQGPTLLLSASVVVTILAGRRLVPHVPVALACVAGAILASDVWHFAALGIRTIGPIPGGLPAFGMPQVVWSDVGPLLPVAASCFVVIIAQSAATARALAARHDERLDSDRDLLGLAAANAAAAFSGAFVVNGSPTQTEMGDRAGARSQVAQIAFAISVVIVLVALTGPLQYLPRCVLAGIVFTIATGMIDWRTLRAMAQESPGEFRLALVTAAAVAVVGVEQGVLLAVALSLLRHVRHSYHPHTGVMQYDAQHGWLAMPARAGQVTRPGVIVYRFDADLFYANANGFADEVRLLVAGAPVAWFVVEADAIIDLDYTAARVLRGLATELKAAGVSLIFARVSASLRADMDRHGVTDVVGADRLFTSRHSALAVIDAALGPPA